MTTSVTPLINYRNKTNSKGFYSIHLRVTIKRLQRYYKVKTPQKVSLKQWGGETDHWVRNTHPYAFEINNKINEKKTVVMNLIKRCYNLNKPVSFYLIDRELNRKGDRAILNDYIDDFIKRPPESVVLTAVTRKKEGQHLDIEEVQKLKKLEFASKEISLERDRDLFLFQVYTGFYYNDLQTLRKDQLFIDMEHGQYIIGERDKNGNPTIIPLFKFPYAATTIKKYRDNYPKRTELFRSDCFVEVQVYNRNLKILASRAEIVHTLSNKTGRHTNAQMWIRFGAERPVLSKMMGHEKEQTTEHYYRVGLREVIEGTKSINFEKLAI